MTESSAAGRVPADARPRQPVHVIGMDRAVAIRVSGYGVVLMFVALQLWGAFAGGAVSWASGDWGLLLFIATLAGTALVHELVHAAFFALLGTRRPELGVGLAGGFLPYAYASAPGERFTLGQFTVIGLAPFVLISIVCIGAALAFPPAAPIATIAFVLNFSGACGDLWMVGQIWRFRRSEDLHLVDLRDGVAVYATGERALAVAARLSHRPRSASTRFLTAALLAALVTLLGALLIPLVLLVLDVRGDFTIGPDAFPLIAVSRPVDGSASATVSLLPAFIAGLAFGTIYTLLRRLRDRTRG